MPSWKSVLPSKYLQAEDLPPGGKPVPMTIKQIRVDKFQASGWQGQTQVESVLVADLYQSPRPMKLNKRKCKVLEALSGSDNIEQWANLDILVYGGMEEIYGEMKPAIIIEANPHNLAAHKAALGVAPAAGVLGQLGTFGGQVTTGRALLESQPQKLMPLDAVTRFRDTAASFNKTWDDFLVWVKKTFPGHYELVHGKDFDSIPHAVVPAMKAYLDHLAEAAKAPPAPPQPAPVIADDREIPF